MPGSVGKIAPSPALVRYSELRPERDIDMFLGKIIMKNDDTVYVYISSPVKLPARTPLYYACDPKMRPTSILSPTGMRHKACAVFKIKEGEAIVGDSVMVKYLAPIAPNKNEDSGNQQG